MSASDNRHIVNAFVSDVKELSREKVQLTFSGNSKHGKSVRVKIDINWSGWPAIVRGYKKAWADQRASRVTEMHSIDKSLPEEMP